MKKEKQEYFLDEPIDKIQYFKKPENVIRFTKTYRAEKTVKIYKFTQEYLGTFCVETGKKLVKKRTSK